MRKVLITILVIAAILLAAGIGTIIYFETRPAASDATESPNATESDSQGLDASDSDQGAAASDATQTPAPTEETVGISLPTEDPAESIPGWTWGENDTAPTGTESSGTTDTTEVPEASDATEGHDENELPPMDF